MTIESAEATAALAERMKASLEATGRSRAEMADVLGVSPQTVDAWLRGLAAPRLAHLMVWARTCGIPFERLTGDEERAPGDR